MPRRAGKPDEKNVNSPEAGSPTMTDQTSMVKSVGAQVMTSVPDWLKAELDANPDLRKAGFENVDGADLVLPRLAIGHGTTPEVKDKESGITFGDAFDTLSKTVIIPAGGSVPVILLVASKSRIWFEKPQPPSPILGRSIDGKVATMDCGMTEKEEKTRDCAKCIRAKFSDDKKPECTEFLSFLAIFPTFNFAVYAISFKSTGLKVGRKILTQAKMTGAMMFGGRWKLSAPEQTNGQNTWYTFDATPDGFVTREEYTRAKELYQSFQGKTWAPADLETESGDENTDFPPKDQAATPEDTKGF